MIKNSTPLSTTVKTQVHVSKSAGNAGKYQKVLDGFNGLRVSNNPHKVSASAYDFNNSASEIKNRLRQELLQGQGLIREAIWTGDGGASHFLHTLKRVTDQLRVEHPHHEQTIANHIQPDSTTNNQTSVWHTISLMTWHERIDAIAAGIIPGGTANDSKFAFGMGHDASSTSKKALKSWLEKLTTGQPIPHDLWRVRATVEGDQGILTWNHDKTISRQDYAEGDLAFYGSIGAEGPLMAHYEQGRREGSGGRLTNKVKVGISGARIALGRTKNLQPHLYRQHTDSSEFTNIGSKVKGGQPTKKRSIGNLGFYNVGTVAGGKTVFKNKNGTFDPRSATDRRIEFATTAGAVESSMVAGGLSTAHKLFQSRPGLQEGDVAETLKLNLPKTVSTWARLRGRRDNKIGLQVDGNPVCFFEPGRNYKIEIIYAGQIKVVHGDKIKPHSGV